MSSTITKCTICCEDKNQGNVCRLCRAHFIKHVVINVGPLSNKPLNCACRKCDKWFPCEECNRDCFDGMFEDYSRETGSVDESEPMELCLGYYPTPYAIETI